MKTVHTLSQREIEKLIECDQARNDREHVKRKVKLTILDAFEQKIDARNLQVIAEITEGEP